MPYGSYYAPGRSGIKYVSSKFLPSGSTMYYLMHKNIKVARFSMTKSGMGLNVLEIYKAEHMPIGTRGFQQPMLNQRFSTWKRGRCIPADRPNKEKVTETTGLMLSEIETINMGVSLSDCYWFKPIDSDYTWKDVNYYENAFSNDIGNILIHDTVASAIDLKTPDVTTNGALPKTWLCADGRAYLLKVGVSEHNQEVCNEVFASLVAEHLGIESVAYYLSKLKDGMRCSLCENFIQDADTEFVSMQQVSVEQNTIGKTGVLQFMQANGLSDSLNKMLVLDFLTMNQDRHFGNFGFLRNADTLQIICAAPMFDYDKTMNIGFWNSPHNNDIAKPFAATHAEQIKYLTDISWLDLSVLKASFDEDIQSIYGAAGFGSREIQALQEFFTERIQLLEKVIEQIKPESLDDKLQRYGKDVGSMSGGRASLSPLEIAESIENSAIDTIDSFDVMDWDVSKPK